MNLMRANRMNDRMNMAIMTINSRQLSPDIIPLGINIPWNIPKTAQEIDQTSKYCPILYTFQCDVVGSQ